MIIAQISDTHLALDTPDANQRIRDFALTVVDINALDPAQGEFTCGLFHMRISFARFRLHRLCD